MKWGWARWSEVGDGRSETGWARWSEVGACSGEQVGGGQVNTSLPERDGVLVNKLLVKWWEMNTENLSFEDWRKMRHYFFQSSTSNSNNDYNNDDSLTE